jgi:hypothetical protein
MAKKGRTVGEHPWGDELGKVTGHDYAPLPDGRIPIWVIATVGDEALAVTPWHKAGRPMRLSAVEIGSDCAMSAREVVGREFTAVGDQGGLHGFRLVNDPRL